MMDPAQFLDIMRPDSGNKSPIFRLGTIPANYVSGRPRIQFDGESIASTRTYPYLASYTPVANNRVMVATVGHGGVVLGKII